MATCCVLGTLWIEHTMNLSVCVTTVVGQDNLNKLERANGYANVLHQPVKRAAKRSYFGL